MLSLKGQSFRMAMGAGSGKELLSVPTDTASKLRETDSSI